jgi:hypothetical protein
VCAISGEPTGDRLRVQASVGAPTGLGVAWLLLLLGPIGIVVLVVIAALKPRRGETLTVQVPCSEPVYEAIRRGRQREGIGISLFIVAMGALLALGFTAANAALMVLVLIAGIGGLGLSVSGTLLRNRSSVGVSLDASRRWVALTGVHPAFVAACESMPERQRA